MICLKIPVTVPFPGLVGTMIGFGTLGRKNFRWLPLPAETSLAPHLKSSFINSFDPFLPEYLLPNDPHDKFATPQSMHNFKFTGDFRQNTNDVKPNGSTFRILSFPINPYKFNPPFSSIGSRFNHRPVSGL